MRDLVKAMNSLAWSLPLFTLQRFADLLDPAGARSPSAALDALTRECERQLGDQARVVFGAGDRLQRAGVDRLLGASSGSPSGRESYSSMALDLMQLSMGGFSLMLPGAYPVWREAQNRTEAFDHFWHSETRSGIVGDVDLPLARRLAETDSLGPYLALWAKEGCGYAHAESAWAHGPPRDLLTGVGRGPLERSLIPLHAGMGLSLARRTLAGVATAEARGELRPALIRLRDLCRANSAPGFEDVAFEGLGLIVRSVHPGILLDVDRQLGEIDPGLRPLFWHGVGRGLYFVPGLSLPRLDGGWRAVDSARREPPDRLARDNALAGLVWALTLVNLRHPQILERFLERHGERLGGEDAVAHGAASAVLVWIDGVGRDQHLEAFLEHRPDSAEGLVAELWERRVRHPCVEAAERLYGLLATRGGLAPLFRYEPLDELRRRLERTPASARPAAPEKARYRV